MKTTHKPFNNRNSGDFKDAWNLLTKLSRVQKHAWGWDFCRLEFSYYRIHAFKHLNDPDFFSRFIHLWHAENDALAGFFVSEYGKNDFQVIVNPDYRDQVEEEILRWAENHLMKEHECIETGNIAIDTTRRNLLIRLGYSFQGNEGFKYLYDLDQSESVFEYALPEGYRIQSMEDAAVDYDARVELIRRAFGNTRFQKEHYLGTAQAPSYSPALDLAVVAPDGSFAAYIIGWINAKTLEGTIEPVGTHPDHRRRGLASSLIKECFLRMKARAVKQVEIAGKSPLYDSLKPYQKLVEEGWTKSRD